MKRLKNIFQYKIYILLFIVFLYVLLFNIFFTYKSKFNGRENNIYGTVIDIKKKDNKLSLLIKSKEKIIVNYYYKNEKEKEIIKIKYHDYIKIDGEMKNPTNNTVFNTFNYKDYLKHKNIYYIFNAKKISVIKSNKNLLYEIKNIISDRIDICKKSGSYIRLFVLGDKNYLDNEIYDTFKNMNIMHLITVSSIHISIIISFLNRIFKKKKIIIILLLLFSFLSNYQISVLKSVLYYIFKIINKEFNLKIKNMNLLLLTISILLIINPLYIYNIGFIFSSLITFSILYFKYLYVYNEIKNSIIVSFIANIVSFPIIINNYYSFNIASIIFSLLFSSYVTYILFPLSFITLLFPIFDNIYYILISIFEKTCTFIDFPFFNIPFSKIDIILIFIYYSIIFCKNERIKIIIPMMILLFYFNGYYVFNTRIYYIDVKQGDSALIRINNKNILIDTGGSINNNIIENNISFFKSIGVKKINYLILSHGDYDHMGEAINLVNNFKVEKVIFNCGPYNELEKELIDVLNKKKIEYYSCIKELNIDKNKLYFLQTKEYDNENDNSNVIYTELNGYRFMFMGDSSTTTEKEILDKYNLLDIDVLKVGHHGSKTSSSKEFIDNIKPTYSIISVGKNNRYGHPNKEVLDTLQDSKTFRTDQDGSIMLKIKNNELKIETCNP